MSKLKKFIKRSKIKILLIAIFLVLGGINTTSSLLGGISSLLEIAAMALSINLIFEWRNFEKHNE